MAKRSVLGLLYLLQGLKAAGEDMQTILHDLSLSPEQLDPSALIDLHVEYAIQKQVVTHIVHPAIGLIIGQQFNLAGYGPLLMLFLTSDNLYKAIQLGVYYQRMTFLFGKLEIVQQQHFTVLTYHSMETDLVMHHFRADTEIAGTFKLLKDIQAALGLNIPIERIDLPFSAPECSYVLEQYNQFYQTIIYFDQPIGALYCLTESLNHKIPSADAMTHQRYRQQCDETLQQYLHDDKHSDLLSKQVSNYLKLQTGFIPQIAAVAYALGMPERTLRYRLASEHTSFRQIRDQLRQAQACQLLTESAYSIETIAEKLHYNEASAFTHAFMRWTGLSPNQYRKQFLVKTVN